MQNCWRLAKESFQCAVIQQTVLPVFPGPMGNNEHRFPQSSAAMVQQLNISLRNATDAQGVHLLSLDVFGIMAWQRPVDLAHTGQDIVGMAKYCDVLSPMIYPSHFFGMDGIAHPGDAPEHFIGESMARFEKITQGSGGVEKGRSHRERNGCATAEALDLGNCPFDEMSLVRRGSGYR